MRRKPLRRKPARPRADAPAGIALPTLLSALVTGGAVLALALSGSLVIGGTAVPFGSNLPILRHPDAIAAPARPPAPAPAPAVRPSLPPLATELPVTFRAPRAGRVAPQVGGDDARATVHTVVHRLHSTETRTGTDPHPGSGGSGSGGTGAGDSGSGGTGAGGSGSGGSGSGGTGAGDSGSGGSGSGGSGGGSTPGGTDGGGCHHGDGHDSGGDGALPGQHAADHRRGQADDADHRRRAGHRVWGHHGSDRNGSVQVQPAADAPSTAAPVSDAASTGEQVGQGQQDGGNAVQG
jgi:hypothetical protein